MRKLAFFVSALGSLALLASAGGAAAKPRHHHHHGYRGDIYAESGRRPLVIERRSFLDPGTKVPVGYYSHYATTPAYVWGGDPTETFQRGRYMDGTLHQAFDPQPTHSLFGGF